MKWIIWFVLLLMFVALYYPYYSNYNDDKESCDKIGGTLVRGVQQNFVCVEVGNKP